jgi:hypothetical protein
MEQPQPHDKPNQPDPEPPSYFEGALDDAERLLKYAAEIGVDIDDDTRSAILHARTLSRSQWDEPGTAKLLTALTKLAARLKPVTAESLKACSDAGQHTIRVYWKVAVSLAAIIVPFSLASFITSGLSDSIRKDIVTANDLAVKISSQLHPTPQQTSAAAPAPDAPNQAAPLPPGLSVIDVVTELQQFASTIRAIDSLTRRLNFFVVKAETDPYADIRGIPARVHDTFQLPSELPTRLDLATDKTIRLFQDIRYFAQAVLDDVSLFYGAITMCLLPVLYATLGTCAYLLRSFEDQMLTKTYIPSVANSARFLIAGIGGAVVGLFNNFTITQGASIPPLALAFLVGYAVDVFFSFLEGLLQAFTKSKGGAGSLAATPSVDGKP